MHRSDLGPYYLYIYIYLFTFFGNIYGFLLPLWYLQTFILQCFANISKPVVLDILDQQRYSIYVTFKMTSRSKMIFTFYLKPFYFSSLEPVKHSR